MTSRGAVSALRHLFRIVEARRLEPV